MRGIADENRRAGMPLRHRHTVDDSRFENDVR
jgi:hypothetical protein